MAVMGNGYLINTINTVQYFLKNNKIIKKYNN